MFMVVLFIIAENWRQAKCPLIEEWIIELWYTYTIKYTPHNMDKSQNSDTE